MDRIPCMVSPRMRSINPGSGHRIRVPVVVIRAAGAPESSVFLDELCDGPDVDVAGEPNTWRVALPGGGSLCVQHGYFASVRKQGTITERFDLTLVEPAARFVGSVRGEEYAVDEKFRDAQFVRPGSVNGHFFFTNFGPAPSDVAGEERIQRPKGMKGRGMRRSALHGWRARAAAAGACPS